MVHLAPNTLGRHRPQHLNPLRCATPSAAERLQPATACSQWEPFPSLAGSLTARILNGPDPVDALKYQVVVMFMLAASTALERMTVSLLAYHGFSNARHQLVHARIVFRKK